MDQDKVIHSGYLLVPPQGKLLIKKSWHQKYCLLYKSSKFGIERLEVFDSIEDSVKNLAAARIVTLENCIKISPKPPNIITIVTKAAVHIFATVSERELPEWVSAVQSVAFKDNISKVTSIEEDNDLYCSSGEGVFLVKVHPSEASARCGLQPKNYTLVLTSAAIQLRNTIDNKLLYTWPYCFIRRYGYREGKFTFEAGRKCDTGEGVFHLEHSNQQQIFRCLSSKMKSMKKILNGETTPTVLDCGDNQFHAALSMEARSRSPLPPSPTSSTPHHESDFASLSQSGGVTKLVSDFGDKPSRGPLPKPKPIKPPRKYVTVKETDVAPEVKNAEPVKSLNYDSVEYRKDAWRTLGTDTVKHTENYVEDNDADLQEYISWSKSKAQETDSLSKNLKILSPPPGDDDSYDRLQFFGSSGKLNAPKPGYRQVQVTPAGSLASAVTPPSWNDYDEVEVNMQAVRLADDSHLGYGVIRKNSTPIETPLVPHQVYNETTYAVVSKPKRV